jgi:hypothetical protein
VTRKHWLAAALVGAAVVVLTGVLWVRAARQSTRAVFAFIFDRVKDAHTSLETADVVVDVTEQPGGLILVSGRSRQSGRRVDSVEALASLVPGNIEHPAVAIVISSPSDSLKPMSDGVEATVLQVRRTLARRGAILPPLGYTVRYQIGSRPTTR